MKSLLTVAAGLAASALLSASPAEAQQNQSKLDKVLARGQLGVGTGSTNAPWHFKSADDKLQGFDIDIGRIIAKALFSDPTKSNSSSSPRTRASPTSPPTRSTSLASS